MDATFVAGKAKMLRAIAGSWEAAAKKADFYASASHGRYKATWEAVAAHIRANHAE